MVDLVIFDCDGVLVDSEPIANRVLADMLGELGLHLTQTQIFEHFVGYSLPDCIKVIEGMLGRAPPSTFRSDLQARTFEAFRSGLAAMPGIEHALNHLDAPYCVASSGDLEKMRMTLGLTGLLPRFDGKLFSVTQVARGKPAPDVYLLAASELGAAPAECVVIEDTPPGVKAGAAAGMTVIGYAAHTSAEMLLRAGADQVLTDMRILPDVLARRPSRK
jgi:HAD superfamily hydrolase (TIGR01509 family)